VSNSVGRFLAGRPTDKGITELVEDLNQMCDRVLENDPLGQKRTLVCLKTALLGFQVCLEEE
jgi:hypothetical protein